MNDYERFKNQLLVELESSNLNFNGDVLHTLLSCLDRTVRGYNITYKGTDLSSNVDCIPMLLKTYIVVKKTEGLSDGTLRNYTYILKSFFLWVRKQPEEVTANDIRMFIYEYKKHRKISDRTLDKYREMICWFFGWAYAEEYIAKNPANTIKAIKYETKERTALTQLELEHLRSACRTVRDKAILEFLYSTGCRVSELINVKKSDIDWHDNAVILFGKGRKYRTSYLNAKAEVAIKEYLSSRDDKNEYLFISEREPHDKITKNSVESVIRIISDRSRIGKRITPHVIRHTTATQAINSGMPVEDISRLLGHASVNTTMIYAKPNCSKVKSEHTRYIV